MPEQQPVRQARILEVTIYASGAEPLVIPGGQITAYQVVPTMVVVQVHQGTRTTFAGIPFMVKEEPSSIVVPQVRLT